MLFIRRLWGVLACVCVCVWWGVDLVRSDNYRQLSNETEARYTVSLQIRLRAKHDGSQINKKQSVLFRTDL